MDITLTILTENVGETHHIGDIVHVESYTGQTSHNKRFALLHVKGCPDKDFETFKQYYLQSLIVAIDGQIQNLCNRKHKVIANDILFMDKTETIDWRDFEARLIVKTANDSNH